MLLQLEIMPVIPSKKNEERKKRAVEFEKEQYRRRNIVERLIGCLKESRCVFARFEKTAIRYLWIRELVIIQRYLRMLAK
ncbi:transposase [Rubinisphaera margarita]|uniref:transposase n=1 Tax=Rubinisphaera margarita TaxID=2909586 RepID=UPI001EE98F13|nr:transposase [Rubinisphaera margarita]MCG6157242.1 transposase [Rubinisphaera margarita]